MKRTALMSLALVLVATTAMAQRPERGDGDRPERRGPGGFGGPRPGGPPPQMFMRMLPVLAALDADKDGELSKEEIENASKALLTLDKNNDGKLDRQEMRPSGPPSNAGRRGGNRGANLAQMFERRDKDGDGKLSGDEVPPQMQQRMARIDSDNDGALSEEELKKAMGQMRERVRDRDGDGEGRRRRGDRPRRSAAEDDQQ